MILVIAPTADEHAWAVERCLPPSRARRHDLASFPAHARVAIAVGGPGPHECELSPRHLFVDDASVVWWRRPSPYSLRCELRADFHEFAYRECHEAIYGLFESLDAPFMNRPSAHQRASNKLLQLNLAVQHGLTIPETLVTNDPVAAKSFIDAQSPARVICKSLSTSSSYWRETRLIGPPEMDALPALHHCPVILQRYIPAGQDLRITIVDEEVFVASIDPKSTDYEFDFRVGSSSPVISVGTIPRDVEIALIRLMATFDLKYAAIDMRRDPEGRFHFLEVNPAGQWLFVEQACGLSITAAVARWLLAVDDM